MKKTFIFAIASIFVFQSQAQIQFSRVNPGPPSPNNLAEIRFASDGTTLAFDIENDGDVDLMVTGRFRASQTLETTIYVNDGAGNFTPSNFVFNGGFRESEGIVLDANNDGFQDFLLTGRFNNLEAKTILFVNDGQGGFSEANLALPGLFRPSVVAGEFDGNAGVDLYLTGETESGTIINALFLNDGLGGFSQMPAGNIPATYFGGVDAVDLNQDGFTDLAVSGDTGDSLHTAIYLNNQLGGFDIENSTLSNLRGGNIEFSDFDSDGDFDVLSTGTTFNNTTIKVYENTGSGFADINLVNFPQLTNSIYSVELKGVDYDLDGDKDLVLVGIGIQIYENNGSNQYSQAILDSFFESSGDLIFADWDNDQDLDLYVSNSAIYSNTGIYINESGEYKAVTGDVTPIFVNAEGVSADLNGDSFDDLLISGFIKENSDFIPTFKVFLSDGTLGGYDDTPQPAIDAFEEASFDVADIDGDNDIDLFIMGLVNNQPTLQLFLNDGNGSMSLSPQSFAGTPGNTVQFFDFDSDGDLDLIYNVVKLGIENVLTVYLNDGNGNFELTIDETDNFLTHDRFILADFDHDALMDVYTYPTPPPNGYGPCAVRFGHLENGNFSFTDYLELTSINIETTSLADIDSDGKLDILLQGRINGQTPRSMIFFNAGARSFDPEFFLFSHEHLGTFDAIDLDADSDLDIVQTFATSYDYEGKVKVYENNGAGGFNEVLNHGLEGFNRNITIAPKFNGMHDLIFNGYNENGQFRSWYFGNESTNLCEQVQSLVSISANSSKLVSNYPDADYYQWLDCSGPIIALPGENDSELILNQLTGSYALVIAKNGCRDTSECFEFDLTGLNSLDNRKTFALFPNPATETFNVVFETPLTGNMHLYDSQGKLLIQVPFHQEKSLEVTSILEPGFYVVKIETAGGIQTGRLLVE